MNLQQAIRSCLTNYVNFKGRSARSEYWFWALFVFVISVATSFLDISLGLANAADGRGPINSIFTLLVLLPSLAVGVRRLHDLDKSGWMYLIVLIPIIGFIVLLVFFVKKGTAGDNRFGADPLGGVVTAA